MGFDLFSLHSPEEDKQSRELLRIYTITRRHSKKEEEKNVQAERIVKILRNIRTKLNGEIGTHWQREWLERIGFTINLCSPKDWFIGRASIPLIAVEKLKKFGCEKEVEEIMCLAEYFCTTTGKATRIPKELNEDIAYLAGAILCDGHLKKNSFRISYELTEKPLIKKFQRLIQKNFCTWKDFNERNNYKGWKLRYRVELDNKVILRFFNVFFEIPRGKKAEKALIPSIISNSSKKIKIAYLKGVFDTDGGKRHRGFGLSASSKLFRDQIAGLIEEFGVRVSKDEWINKKYNKKYYGLSFHKKYGFLPFLHG